MLIHSIESVLTLLILIAVGWLLAGKPWFREHGPDLFSKFSVNVAIPCYMTYNVLTAVGTRENMGELFRSLPVPFLTLFAGLGIGFLFARMFRIPKARGGVFVNAAAFSNTVIIGFPVITALYGDAAAPDGMIYYLANTILFWTVGVSLLRRDGSQAPPTGALQTIRKFFSPPIIGFLLGAALVLLGIQLPAFLFRPLTMIKETTTPVAMMFIGSIIRKTDFRKTKFTRDLLLVLGSRFVLSPLAVGALCLALPLDPLMKQVFVLLASMPAMTQLGIMAKETNSDYEFASTLVAITTLVSMAVIPVIASASSALYQ